MSIDFIYFEYQDTDGIWKTHPIESVKYLATIPDGDSYPAWKHGICLAIAYHEDGELTKRMFKPLWDASEYYIQNGMWNHPGYFKLRLVSSDGLRIPVNCGEGNGPHYKWETHCIFGYLSPSLFEPDDGGGAVAISRISIPIAI